MNEEYITIFAVIPKEIYQTKSLSPEDKLIAERLVYLCKKEGYSWVTNKALADMYGIREDSVSQHITNLKNYGFIKCVYTNETHSKSNRTIYLTEDLWGKYKEYNRFNNQETIGSIPGHNNNYNYKYNNNYNIKDYQISYDTDGVMLWHGKRCESVQASPEEIAEMEAMIYGIVGDSNE